MSEFRTWADYRSIHRVISGTAINIIGDRLSAAGPSPYIGDILEHPDILWAEDDWNEEKLQQAQTRIEQQGNSADSYWKDRYSRKAGTFWHQFYRRNLDNFFKDRHYLHIVFPELLEKKENGARTCLLEVGCGVGNAILPLLEINDSLSITAIDFANSAIDILSQTVKRLRLQSRIQAFCVCLVNDDLPVSEASMDLVLCMFVMSAVAPEDQRRAFSKLALAMRPGGKMLFRDYGRYDEAQLRFQKGSKLDDNFYVRQDGTCSYFFDLEELRELATQVGLRVIDAYYIRRQYSNRQQKQARYRIWVHAKFEKVHAVHSSG